jgi:polysaccharide biosynthesis protein PelE
MSVCTGELQWYSIAMLVAGSIVDLTLTAMLVDHVLPRPEVFAAHGLLSAILILIYVNLWRAGEHDPLLAIFVTTTTFMGPFGASGSVLAALVRVLFQSQSTTFQEWHASLFPQLEIDPVRQLYQELAIRGAKPVETSSVAPFTDVIALGTVQQKQTVTALIADNFRPGFTPALMAALNDPEPAVRVQAATAATRIENHFLQESLALEDARARHQDDPELLKRLAHHADARADTGLLDPEPALAARRQALAFFQRYAAQRPSDIEITAAISRLHLQLGSPDEALRQAETCVAAGGCPPSVVSCYLQALYECGRFEDLRQACMHFRPALLAREGVAGDNFIEAIRLWFPALSEKEAPT